MTYYDPAETIYSGPNALDDENVTHTCATWPGASAGAARVSTVISRSQSTRLQPLAASTPPWLRPRL
jgi:hypothetical protein